MKKSLIGTLGLGMAMAGLLFASSTAHAWPGRGRGMGRGMGAGCPMMAPGMGPGGPGMGPGMAGPGFGRHFRFMMNATADQIAKAFRISRSKAAQLVAARDAFIKQSKTFHLKMARVRVWIMNQWLADKPDFNKLRALHNKMFNLRKRLADLRFEFRIKGYKILGRDKALELMRRRMMRGRGRWFGRAGGHGRRGRGLGRGRGHRFRNQAPAVSGASN